MKKLFRSKTDRRVSGIFGGLAVYWGIDATLLRVGYIFFTLFVGVIPAILGYILAAIVIPEEGDPDYPQTGI